MDILNIVLICVFAVIYAWVLYNLPILAVGIKNLRLVRQKHSSKNRVETKSLPYYSVVVPVKNEEKVIGRLLTSLSKLDYPKDKIEITVVEDGSNDNTLEVCKRFASTHANVKILEKISSNGKPSALNYGIEQSQGDIIAIFDADNVPAKDALLKAAGYFEDSKVAAVQGRTMSINSKENMLTQFISYEEAVWCEAYLRGKDSLGLFVHLKGSCQFIRRSVFNQLAGFDESMLSEDMEFSARLAEKNYSIRYGGDVSAWQESPSDLKTLFKQRTRWFRGTMDVTIKYGRLLTKINQRNFDAEVTLFGPFILIASLLSYIMAFGIFLTEYPFNLIWTAFSYFSIASMTAMTFLCGLALIYVSKPKRLSNLLWLPFVFAYWFAQGFIALYAGLLSLLHRPKHWVKTEKKGTITDPVFTVEEPIYA